MFKANISKLDATIQEPPIPCVSTQKCAVVNRMQFLARLFEVPMGFIGIIEFLATSLFNSVKRFFSQKGISSITKVE